MNYLTTFWQKITNNGIDEQILGESVVKARLLNQLTFIGFITSSLVLFTYVFTDEKPAVIFATLINFILEIITIFIAYKQRHDWVQFLICILFPSIVAIYIITLGGHFGETNIFTALGLTAFIVYENKRRYQIAVIGYICSLFIFSKLYVVQYFDFSDVQRNPYDEIVTFPMILLILGLIIMLYQKELKKYQLKQSILIHDLEQKNNSLLQVNEELEQFTYIASHDLKTPLRSINSHLDLIRFFTKRKRYDDIEESLNFAQKGAKQMYALISDILEYKTVNNQSEDFESIDLNEIAANVLLGLESILVESKAEIICEVLPKIKGRKSDFIILFQNFIENGIKYNDSELPKIWITTKQSKDKFTITFKDNGIGISPKYHKQIFKFFKRLHTQEKYQGTGIGLGLCKKIIHNYNGKITLESKEGTGSTFNINLPLEIIKS